MRRLSQPLWLLPALCLLLANTATATRAIDPKQTRRPRLDVTFILDTTGSMGDEIEVVKEKLVSIATKLSTGQPAPDVRFAVVAYRDRGDAYVTKVKGFDRDISKVQAFIRRLSAGGGGDTPEDVAAGMHAALKLRWDRSANVARVAFLVGDAGPQSYANARGWKHAVTAFREKKITVHTIGCSGLEASAKGVFRQVAELTKGDFQALTYRRLARSADGKTKTILHTGGEVYVAEGDLDEAEWKKGADRLMAEGRVKRRASGSVSGIGGMGAVASAGRRMRSGGPAAAAPAMVFDDAALENNLDEEISGKLMEAAEAAGASYAE